MHYQTHIKDLPARNFVTAFFTITWICKDRGNPAESEARPVQPGGFENIQEGILGEIWLVFLVIPLTVMVPGAFLTPPFIFGFILAWIAYLFWKSILHAPHTLRVEGNSLFAKSFRSKLELSAGQIKDIRVISVRNCRGVAKSLVQITDNDGNEFTCIGFPEGVEMMYGYLQNWWNQNRTV